MMEKLKSSKKNKKDRSRSFYRNKKQIVDDTTTLEEFECLLGESPANYVQIQSVDNMESELHSAAIDNEPHEKVDTQVSITVENKQVLLEEKILEQDINQTIDESSCNDDLIESLPTAPPLPPENNVDIVTLPDNQPSPRLIIEHNTNTNLVIPKIVEPTIIETNDSSNNNTTELSPLTDAQLISLYNNKELTLVESFITEFIETQLCRNSYLQQHRLYDLLTSYLRVKNKLQTNSHDLECIKKKCTEVRGYLWHLEKTSITESGECQDGNPVNATHEYLTAWLSQDALKLLSKLLSKIKELLHNIQALHSYEAETLRLQIEQYVQRVCLLCKEAMKLPQNAPVNLLSSTTMSQFTELRMCITILFSFQRRMINDNKFVMDSREWLSQLVATLLRVATWQDHQFILNHVLRCPGGVTKWAASFIQAPNVPLSQTHTGSPFSDSYLDHMVATLAVILLPVKDREKFLEQVRESVQDMTGNSTVDTVWVVLDEDGEEDEDISNTGGNLSEADIIMLVKQVPLGKIFEQVLLIEKQGETYRQETNNITEHHMLRLFAFSSILVRLFRQGLQTYNSPKYRQLAKLLSSMIRDVVQYVNDQWEVFLNNQTNSTELLLFPRLQTEFDEFFLRSTMSIISSRRLGALQYLAAIPYHTISINTLWRIFYALHHDNVFLEVVDINQFENESKNGNLWRQFDEKLSEMQEEESYFLISTFANMALARSECDIKFICATTIDLFKIGFLSKKSPESTSKNARSLLSSLTIKHPSLLSTILLTVKENFESFEKFELQLFTELNIDKWIPGDNDIFIIANWLRNNTLQSTENHLARLLLKNLNWGLDNNKNLYLPLQLHYNIALLIVELTMKYVPDMPGNQTASLLIEGVRQVSSMVRPQNSEHVFSIWAWDMVCRLRLHQLDQSDEICQKVMTNPAGAFAHVPDIDTNTALEILVYGVKEKQPIACFVSVMMTLWGHSVPLTCTTGFSKLNILQNYHKYKHILIALQHIIPLFLECPESLINNDKFIDLVVSLITADRTYVKMAKNLIASEFPGPIVKYFANMIESHLTNYEKYCLHSPEPFVRLWLEIVFKIPNWNRDQNVMYIIDCILRTAFFHIDSRTTADMLFLVQYSIMGNEKSSGSISSFINWATGNSNLSSLLGGSVHSIWLAFQVLSIEQHSRETNTGFWREFLRELSNQSKTSLDTAIKRACLTVKISPFSSGELSIYRWSQQILDTPFDHPLFPLLWQRFFILYLARIPTNPGIPDRGGIGEKFFDGLINGNHLKKLKKYLTETIKYFENIIESSNDNNNDDDDDKAMNNNERRDFILQTIKYYKTLNLWLNEERLLESGLYLPALPPQYMSHKLTALIQSDYDPWLEYVDYSQVLQSQLKSNQEWNKISYRCDNNYDDNNSKSLSSSIVTAMTLESSDPLQRIFRRLSTYEYSQSPPLLIKNTTAIFENISRNILHEADQVIQIIRPHFKAILEYAQTFDSLILEHTAVDCSFLELIKNLYQDVENTVTLHALCDSVSSSDHQHSRSGSPLTVHCAGAAVIKLSVKEAQLTPGVDQMIIKNRGKYDNLVVKACQLPSSKVVQASVFIDRIIMLLENEINIHNTCEDTVALNKIHASGIKLFYYLVKNYTEEASLCPPTKQLVTACIEKLGQIFISGEENEGPRLLATIIERPNLGGILGPHFTPVAGAASKFLEMYSTIVNLSAGSNVDLCFVLLSKFDANNWLNHRRPRLSERSTFIDLVIKALCDIGLNPDDKKLILHELFRNHLKLVLLYEFPEHYGEVLSAILRGSEGQNLSLDVWQDFLGALSGKLKTETPIHPFKIREEIRRYATEQRLLSKQDIYDTAQLLSKHFMMERLQYGLYGLYPKYRVYNEPLVMFLGMIGHALVVSTLQIDRGSLANQICEQIWPVLSEMFAPWLTPYWTKNLIEPTAAWIQQLTDDRSVLLPWITSDGPHANRIVAIFVECIRFIIDTLPASSKILCLLWQFYVTNYAHASVKDHIVNVIHGNLLTLTWDKFSPSVNDVELMVKVIDQYLPDCHLFLGSIFTSVNWTIWINEVIATQPHSVAVRMHICLLNLFIKLSNEPNVRNNEKAIQLVTEATKFSWHLVDAIAYDQVINWYVMSCNPLVILSCNNDNDDIHQLDIAINNMIKIVAAYDQSVSNFHPTTLKKRQLYVRSSMKLLMNCAIRHKSLLTTNTKVFKNTLTDMLNEMEIIIIKTVPELQQVAEAGLLLTELLESMNHQKGPLIEQLRESWINWLSAKTASSPILIGLLRVIGMTVSSPSIFGEILEASLESYFTKSITCEIETSWGAVMNILQPLVPRQPPIETVLNADNQLLALYAVLLKKLPLCRDIKDEEVLLVNLIDWISNVKPMENIQEKLPLLWAKAFELSYRQCQYNDSTVFVARSLKQLARALIALADDSGQGWGIFGVIGLRKSSQLSIRFKFIARALSVYCLMQLPESNSEQPIVRFTPHSPGTITSSMLPDVIDEIQPNPDAVKGIKHLETMITNKQYGEFKDDIELAVKMIKDSENSLHNAVSITGKLTTQLYTKQYLHILKE